MAAAERSEAGHRLGIHRVLGGEKVLPQSATRLDNSLPIYPSEALVKVERLNIDAASFVQMEEAFGGDGKRIGEAVLTNTRERGKQQNAITGSGGVLVGEIVQVGSAYGGPMKLGQKIVTLVSLTSTPLYLERVGRVHNKTHQIEAVGHAVLFESTIGAELPDDLPETVALAVLDVCGAPAWPRAVAKKDETVVVLGAGGKAGVLSCVAAREAVGPGGCVIGLEPHEGARKQLEALGVCDHILTHNAADCVGVLSGVESATHGKMGDVVINVVSAPNTEMSSILSTREDGKVVFFGMATAFTKAALGAESIAANVQMFIGNGYFPGHAEYSLGLLRKYPNLKKLFCDRYQS